MKKYRLHIVLIIFFAQCMVNLNAQNTSPGNEVNKTGEDSVIARLRAAVEDNPNDYNSNWAYIKAMKFDSPDLIKQYDEWIKKYPQSVIIPYSIGEALTRRENPRAKPYLMKALEIDPNYAKAYMALSSDAERWGDFKAADAFLKKAKDLDPNNADYAFSYAWSLKVSDPEMYKKLSLEVAMNFPNTEKGAQSLYWLANSTENIEEKITYYEQQRKNFPIEKFAWTRFGMSDYFNLILMSNPSKAKSLAKPMASLKVYDDDDYYKKLWEANIILAENIAEAKEHFTAGKFEKSVFILNKIVLPKYCPFKNAFVLFKSSIEDAANKTVDAYQTLLVFTAKEPDAKVNQALISYGKKLGKDEKMINKDVLYLRDTASKIAPNFTLETYLSKGVSSLSDYKGKVVLLTYWFPGCGPCRGEFPHFENVVQKFKGKEFVYLAINIVGKQDEYVVPFVKSSGYSFIPLKDNAQWTKGPLDNQQAAPVNFLIDQNGRIIFSNFRTDQNNEATLEMMINSLLTGIAI